MERCIFSRHERACIGISDDATVRAELCEFVSNPQATILHANYPVYPSSLEEPETNSSVEMVRNLIRDGKARILYCECLVFVICVCVDECLCSSYVCMQDQYHVCATCMCVHLYVFVLS
jgi:hypothetical protein